MNKDNTPKEMTFFDHLEELRWAILRSLGAIGLFSITAFIFKDFVFNEVLFGPTKPDFWTYRMLCKLSDKVKYIDVCINEITYSIVNLEMAGQFMVHLTTSFAFGLVFAFPYLIWELWRFISPGLKREELKASRFVILFSSILFFVGVLFGYFLLTPFSINFFATYQVSNTIQNTFSLTNYINFLTMFVLACGLMFELPVIVLLLAKLDIVDAPMMRDFRKHSLVIIMIISAIITPADIGTMIMVAVPIYVLYEMSIFIAAFINPTKNNMQYEIAIGSDHAGYELKEELKFFLEEKGFKMDDKGTYSLDSVDYPDFAHTVSTAVENKEVDFGVLICGSGNGISIAANKHQGVRAAIAWLPEVAALAKQHNNANILSLPARFVTIDDAKNIVESYLNAEFEGGRHQRRVDKIKFC